MGTKYRYSWIEFITRWCGVILMAAALSACITLAPSATLPIAETDPAADSTLLLVSLEDGSIIRQHIFVDADICMKTIDAPATICFQRGAAIMRDNQVIAYEMNRTEIQLHSE